MRPLAVVFAASLLLASACGTNAPTLPEVRPAYRSAADDPGFTITPRPPCAAEADAAFSDPDAAAITKAAARGITFTCGDREDPPFLSKAIFKGDLARIARLLEAGADPNARWSTRGDRLPIQDAIECRRFGWFCIHTRSVVDRLLRAGADPNARWCEFESRLDGKRTPGCTSDYGTTPLIAASAMDESGVIQLLLDAGADPWTKHKTGYRALDHAISSTTFLLLQAAMFPDRATRHARTYALLRDTDAAPWIDDSRIQTPLARFVSGAVNIGPLPPPPPPPSSAPRQVQRKDWLPDVHYIRQPFGDRAGLVDVILEMGADPNQRLVGSSDWTPLALALSNDDHFTAEVLLSRGADPNAAVCRRNSNTSPSDPPRIDNWCGGHNDMTPLMLAAMRAAVDTMRLLIAKGADLHARDGQGRSVADYVPPDARRTVMDAAQKSVP